MSGVCAGVTVVVTLPPTIPGTHWVKSAGSTARPHTKGITLLPAPAARAKGSASHSRSVSTSLSWATCQPSGAMISTQRSSLFQPCTPS